MSRRPKVPAALHSELSEYASLLRALQTNQFLDLATQLTFTPGSTGTSTRNHAHEVEDGLLRDVDHDGTESEHPTSESFSISLSISVDGAGGEGDSPELRRLKRKAKVKAAQAKRLKKDTWTRWPLLSGDVHVPEWSLEDEVKALSTHALKRCAIPAEPDQAAAHTGESQPQTTEGAHDHLSALSEKEKDCDADAEFMDDEEEALLAPHALSALTSSVSAHLSQILALLAAYVPSGGRTMQNRVRPLNWETVLEVVAVNGIVDPGTLENVRKRLSVIFPPSSDRKVHHHTNDDSLATACAAYDLSFLDIQGPDPDTYTQPVRAKRGPYKKRQVMDIQNNISGFVQSQSSRKRRRVTDG